MWPALNLVGHLTSLSGPVRAWNSLLPMGVTPLIRNHCGGLDVFVSDAPRIFNDIAEILPIMAIFPRIVVLGDAPAHNVFS
jgi:hypothetical protein